MRFSLRAKFLGVLLPALLVLVGLQLYGALHYRSIVVRSRATAAHAQAAVHAALDGQVHFKKQVQEWKNVLLRGHDPDDYAKYLRQFEQEESATRRSIRRVVELLDEEPQARALAEQFLRSHERLGGRYRRALETYRVTPSRADAAWVTDRLVRGIDREPTDRLDLVVERVLEVRDRRLARIEAELATVERRVAGFLVLTLLGALAVIIRVVNRTVLRPIKRAEAAARRISTGDFSGEIQGHDRDESGELLQALASMQHNLMVSREALDAQNQRLRVARDAALEAARIKAEFLANMSHELRTPLNGVLGMVQLLEDTGLDDEQREYVGLASTSGHQLLGLINDVLDFSKLEAGRVELTAEPFRLRACVESLVSSLAPRAYRNRVEMIVDIDPGVDTVVHGDEHRLGQVLNNLVGNAVKFTREGEIRVVAEPLRVVDEGPDVRISVVDTGVGMSRDARKRIFEAFTQADGTTTREFGGTGLGLTIARSIVGLMDGEMGVESEPGRGSTFWFTARLRPTPVNRPCRPLDGVTVGLAVPGTTCREVLERDLSAQGGDVVLLEELMAPAEVDRIGVDVVVVDGGVDDEPLAIQAVVDGWSAVTRDRPTVVLRPRGSRALGSHSRLGDRVLSKPMRLDELVDAVRDHCGRAAV